MDHYFFYPKNALNNLDLWQINIFCPSPSLRTTISIPTQCYHTTISKSQRLHWKIASIDRSLLLPSHNDCIGGLHPSIDHSVDIIRDLANWCHFHRSLSRGTRFLQIGHAIDQSVAYGIAPRSTVVHATKLAMFMASEHT